MSSALISLIIPTQGRENLLERLLTYLSGRRSNLVVYIADDTSREFMPVRLNIIRRFQSRLQIIHLIYDECLPLIEKIAKATKEVVTPFAVIGADDDFVVPQTMERGALFLQVHPEYSAVHGDGILFSLKSGTASGEIASAGRYPQRTIEHRTGSHRLLDHMGQYSTTWYSVQRTEQLQENWQKAAGLELDIYFGELLPTCLSLIQGKVKKLDALYLIRQVHGDSTSASAVRQLDLFDWVTVPNWAGQYQLFCECLAEELVRQDGISLQEGREVVKRAFWSYLARVLMKKWQVRYEQDGSGFLSRLRAMARRIPALRGAWHKVRSFLPGEGKEMSLPRLLRPSSLSHADFMPIYNAITTPPGLNRRDLNEDQ